MFFDDSRWVYKMPKFTKQTCLFWNFFSKVIRSISIILAEKPIFISFCKKQCQISSEPDFRYLGLLWQGVTIIGRPAHPIFGNFCKFRNPKPTQHLPLWLTYVYLTFYVIVWSSIQFFGNQKFLSLHNQKIPSCPNIQQSMNNEYSSSSKIFIHIQSSLESRQSLKFQSCTA